MRVYLESGNAWWMADFNDGNVVIRHFDGLAETTTEKTFDSQEQAVQEIRTQIGRLHEAGYIDRTHPDERWKQDEHVAQWYANGFFETLKSLGAKPRHADRGLRHELAADLHVTFAPELQKFLEFRDQHTFGYTNFQEWRIWDEDLELPDMGTTNRFEQRILLDQNNYLGTAMSEVFMGAVYLGSLGNGDAYLACQGNDPDAWEIVFWDHEENYPSFLFADSISSLAFANQLLDNVEDAETQEDQLISDFQKIQDRVKLSWHFNSLEEETGLEPDFKGTSNARYYYWRMAWVNYLLRANGVVEIRNISNYFVEQIHAQLTFEDAKKYIHVRRNPLTQYYWMWRLFWFNQPELQEMLEIAENAPSPLVRDCASLIRELQSGRKQLGKIQDIHALREQFIALDLDPARAEQRAAELAEKEARTQAEKSAAIQRANQLAQGESPESLLQQAVEFIGQPEALHVIYDVLRHKDPEVEFALRRLEFLTEGRATRQNRYYDFENDQIVQILGARGPKIFPLLATVQPSRHLEILGYSQTPAGVDTLLKVLTGRGTDPNYHNLVAALDSLGRLVPKYAPERTAETIAAILDVAKTSVWEQDDYVSGIRFGDTLRASVDALAKLDVTPENGPDVLPFLVHLALHGPDDTHIAATKAAARIVARTGQPNDDLLGLLGRMLTRAEARPALFCLAILAGAKDSGHAQSLNIPAQNLIEQHLATRGGLPKAMAYETVMLQWMRQRRGLDYDFDAAFFAFDLIETSKYIDAEMHEALIQLLLVHPDHDYANARLHEYTWYGLESVAEAAIEALQQRTNYAPVYVDRVDAEQARDLGIDHLTELLRNKDLVWPHNVLRAAAEITIDDAFAQAATEALARICRPSMYGGGYASNVYNTIDYALQAAEEFQHPVVDRFLGTLLHGGNPLYAKPLDDATVKRVKSLVPTPVVETLSYAYTKLGNPLWMAGGAIHGLVQAEDGRIFAATNAGLVVFDPSGAPIAHPLTGWLYDVQLHENLLVVCGHSGQFVLLDATTYERLPAPQLRAGIRKARFSPDKTRIAVVSDGQYWAIVDPRTGELLGSHSNKADVNGVDWIDDQTLVVTTDRAVEVYTLDGTETAHLRTGGGAEVRCANGELFVGTPKGLWRLDRQLKEVAPALKQANIARIEIRGNTLYAASYEGKDTGVWAWDLTKAKRKRYKGHDDSPVFGMCLTKDGIAAGGNLRAVRQWDAKGNLRPLEISGHRNEIAAITQGRDGRILTVSDDRQVLEWDVKNNQITAHWAFDFRTCYAGWSPDHQTLYVCGSDNVVALDPNTGTEIWRNATVKRAEYLAVTQASIVCASYNALVWVDRLTGETQFRTEPFADSFIFHWVQTDPNTVVCAGYDDTQLFVFDLTTRELLRTIPLGAGERDRLRAICGIDSSHVALTRTNDTLSFVNVTSAEVERVVALPSGKLVYDLQTQQIIAWFGSDTYAVSKSGQVKTLGTSLALERAATVHGLILGGTKAGDVVVFG